MSRRDTIIIALLVNAGLLALLFMLAINTDEDPIIDGEEIAKTIIETRTSSLHAKSSPTLIATEKPLNDEVDSFLKDLASDENMQPFIPDDEEYSERELEHAALVAKPIKNETHPQENSHFVDITVKRGDALEKIARSNGITVEAIKKANNLSNAKLSIGQVLKIPVSNKLEIPLSKDTFSSSSQKKEIAVEKPANTSVQYYTIKSGDNPWKIAKQYHVKFEDLLLLNNLDEERARNLKIGDKVRVR